MFKLTSKNTSRAKNGYRASHAADSGRYASWRALNWPKVADFDKTTSSAGSPIRMASSLPLLQMSAYHTPQRRGVHTGRGRS